MVKKLRIPSSSMSDIPLNRLRQYQFPTLNKWNECANVENIIISIKSIKRAQISRTPHMKEHRSAGVCGSTVA